MIRNSSRNLRTRSARAGLAGSLALLVLGAAWTGCVSSDPLSGEGAPLDSLEALPDSIRGFIPMRAGNTWRYQKSGYNSTAPSGTGGVTYRETYTVKVVSVGEGWVDVQVPNVFAHKEGIDTVYRVTAPFGSVPGYTLPFASRDAVYRGDTRRETYAGDSVWTWRVELGVSMSSGRPYYARYVAGVGLVERVSGVTSMRGGAADTVILLEFTTGP